jgi:phosphate transport system permease protein
MSANPQRSWRRRAGGRGGTSILAHGENMLWLMGGALAVCIVMIVGLLALVIYQGATTFWPQPIVAVTLDSGRVLMGEVARRETFDPSDEVEAAWSEETRRRFDAAGSEAVTRQLMRTGNFDVSGSHFEWVDEPATALVERPAWAVVLERRSWGRFYGFPAAFEIDGQRVASGPEATWREFAAVHGQVADRFRRRHRLQKHDFGKLHALTERARLDVRDVEIEYGTESPEYRRARTMFEGERAAIESRGQALEEEIRLLDEANNRYEMLMATASGDTISVPLSTIVRGYPANNVNVAGKLAIYASRWKEFLLDDPREANSEGGVWPAIVGTVIMTLLMSVAVVPFGVLAALYLREYAKAGLMISTVRVAINNMAGVPSIVFGVFGLGFFCYIMGGGLDSLFFAEKLPDPTYGKGGVLWASLTLALLTLPVVVVATEEALAAVPQSMREGSYACGASKWQTIRRIVLPRAMPGIMTGFILAMARGAGEVAPLMLVGAVKLAPELPLDGVAPYLHPDRSFMHLGFHIFDLGFQSQNSEAAKPMVFTTTLLLITLIATLNIVAVLIRTRLRRKFVGGTF